MESTSICPDRGSREFACKKFEVVQGTRIKSCVSAVEAAILKGTNATEIIARNNSISKAITISEILKRKIKGEVQEVSSLIKNSFATTD